MTHVNAQFNRCAGVTDGIFLSDLVSCNGFYYCFDNTVVNHGYCPQGFYFVETTQSCDPSEIVNCDWACPSTGFIRKPVRISCSDYIECLSGIGTRKTCPGDLLFDPIIAECNTQTTCIANPCPTFNVPGAPIFIPHYQDCTRYYIYLYTYKYINISMFMFICLNILMYFMLYLCYMFFFLI